MKCVLAQGFVVPGRHGLHGPQQQVCSTVQNGLEMDVQNVCTTHKTRTSKLFEGFLNEIRVLAPHLRPRQCPPPHFRSNGPLCQSTPIPEKKMRTPLHSRMDRTVLQGRCIVARQWAGQQTEEASLRILLKVVILFRVQWPRHSVASSLHSFAVARYCRAAA